MRWIGTAVLLVALAGGAIAIASAGSSAAEVIDLNGQGGGDLRLADATASLERVRDGLKVHVEAETPEPGSYEYPTGDMIPAWGTPHPEVIAESPEVFTLWIVVFNRPELCTDDVCNGDDFDPGAAAEGGLYMGDGSIVDSDRIVMRGDIAVGHQPLRGTPLQFPNTAEVHVALAPHGQAATGADLARQLTGPVGNPSLWWGGAFSVPEATE